MRQFATRCSYCAEATDDRKGNVSKLITAVSPWPRPHIYTTPPNIQSIKRILLLLTGTMYQGAKVTGVTRGHRRSFPSRYENSFALVYSSDQFPSKLRTATFAENLAVISPASICLVVILMVSRFLCRYKHKYSNTRTRVSDDEKPPF